MTTNNAASIGCDFDAQTAKYLAGKKVIALVMSADEDELLAIAGQQNASFNMSAPNSSATTKDDDNDGWLVRYYSGGKTWDASVDGLWSVNDAASKRIAAALAGDEYLCLAICEREKVDGGYKYTPIRKGTALVSSDNFRAPNDDNVTYTMNFEGTGEPWLRELHTAEEVAEATYTATSGSTGSTGSEG